MLDIEVVDIWKYVNFTNTFDKLKQLNAQMAANVCHSTLFENFTLSWIENCNACLKIWFVLSFWNWCQNPPVSLPLIWYYQVLFGICWFYASKCDSGFIQPFMTLIKCIHWQSLLFSLWSLKLITGNLNCI